MSLMNVTIPPNAQVFFGYIFDVIAFDPIDIQDSVEQFFNLKQGDEFELEENFVQLGYESSYFVSNLGSMILIWSIQLGLIPVLTLVYTLAWRVKKIRKWAKDKLGGIFFNSLIALVDSTFLIVFVKAFVNIQ